MSVDERDLSTLLSGATLVIVGQLAYSLFKLGERLLVGRVLTPGAYGDVSMALAVMTIAVTIGMVGLGQGVPRYISRFDNQQAIRGAWITGISIAGLVGIVIAFALILGAKPLADLLFEDADAATLLTLIAVAIPFIIGMNIAIGAVRGLENTIYRTYTRDLFYPVIRLLVLGALLFGGVGILSVGYAYVLGAFATFVLIHVLLNRLLPLAGSVRTNPSEMLVYSLPLVLAALISRLLTRTDTLMLGYFRSSAEVGLYSAAFPLAGALLLVLSSFGFMYLPVASRLDSEDKLDEIDAIYKISTKWVFVLTFPAFLALVIFSRDILVATFGSAYAPASGVLSILAFGFLSRAAFGRNKETIEALGYTKYLLLTTGLAFALNIGLNLSLIPLYGATGAAVASATTFIGLNVAVYLFLSYKFDLTPFSTWTRRSMIVLPLGLVPPALLLASQVRLTLVTVVVFVVVTELLAIVIVVVTGCLQPQDEILISFVEDILGVRLPLIRRYIPDAE